MQKEPIYTMTIKIARGGTEHIEDGKSSESTAGHMWYTLAKDGEQTKSYGFIPEGKGVTDLFGLWTKGDIATNDESAYQASYATYEVRVTKEQYDKLVDFGKEKNLESNGFSKTYDVPTNSCVDYVYKAMEFAGVNPDKFEGDMFPKNNRDNVNEHLYKAITGTEIPKEEQALENTATDGSFTAIYGSRGADVLSSTKETEVVYGGIGKDRLNGLAGHVDRLRGGTEYDTYSVQEKDYIKDSDGNGEIYFNAKLLSGVKHKVSEGVYADEMFTYTQENNNLIIAQKADPSKSITVEHWDRHQKMLDIELSEQRVEEKSKTPEPLGVTMDMSELTLVQKEETTDYSKYLPEHLRPNQEAQTQEEYVHTASVQAVLDKYTSADNNVQQNNDEVEL